MNIRAVILQQIVRLVIQLLLVITSSVSYADISISGCANLTVISTSVDIGPVNITIVTTTTVTKCGVETVTVETETTPVPIIDITASEVLANGSSENSSLSITFTPNKLIRNFELEDVQVTNGQLSNFIANDDNTIFTATLTPVNGGIVSIDIDANKFVDTMGYVNKPSTRFNWTYLSNPVDKTSVTDSIKTMGDISTNVAKMNFTAIGNRISWLDANTIPGSDKGRSHQGVQIRFTDPVVDKIMNTTYTKPGKLDTTNTPLEFLHNNLADITLSTVAITQDVKSQLDTAAFNEIAKVREDTIDKILHATGGKVINDWSVWTGGKITLGKTYAATSANEQKSKSQNVSIGFDRPIRFNNHSKSDEHLIGLVFGIGKSDTNIGTNATVDADSFSLTSYGVIKQNNKPFIEAMLGIGQVEVDKTRVDGADNLTGSHKANQAFGSLIFRKGDRKLNDFKLSPYGQVFTSKTWYDGYSESGGATALTYDKQTIESTVLSVGADMEYLIPIQNGNIRPFMKFEYGADVSGSSTVNMHYNNETTNYQLELDNKADSNWKFVLGTDMYTKDEWDSSISYERTEAVNSGYSDSLAVKVGLKF